MTVPKPRRKTSPNKVQTTNDNKVTPKAEPEVTGEPPVVRCCGNCTWADAINGSERVLCDVPLPPMIDTHNRGMFARPFKTYGCALFKQKE